MKTDRPGAFAQLVNGAPWPEQVHLSFQGDYSVMGVMWTTFEYDNAAVQYGTSPTNLPFTATDEGVKQWTSGTSVRYSHKAIMRNLQPLTKYYYQIGTRQFSFKTMDKDPQTYKVCIFGDLGYFHGNSTESLIRNGLAGKFDFIVHVGDIAYDLHSENGAVGDKYMNQLEPLIATVPYMAVAGNHEDDGKNFTDYQERFWMPDNIYHDHQFYSFDIGPIHWLGVSSEYYGYYYLYGMDPVTNMYEWLKDDLKAANANRATTPWIITFQHRPFYCSNTNSVECQSFENKLIRTGWLDMPGLEPLFLQYGVDMGFWGHEHSYERMYPIADRQFWNSTDAYNNPPAPVYVITGSAGCHSPYAQFSDNPWPFSAARINDFGYSILTVANSTHLHMEQISIEKNDSVVDEVWVVKDHGYTHSPTVRAQRQGWKFPQMKCHPKNIACRMSLQQLNEEL
ncbi:hypothetical protein Q1695_002766 [Nippostrongylus brasiliensis]|nr:hypothetical protein Q1695_002766 [Nippostrongylus brasiliensis]